MADLSSIVKQLKEERDRVEQQLSGLNAALAAFAGVYRGTAKPTRKRRKMSAKSRAQIAGEGTLGQGQSKAEELKARGCALRLPQVCRSSRSFSNEACLLATIRVEFLPTRSLDHWFVLLEQERK